MFPFSSLPTIVNLGNLKTTTVDIKTITDDWASLTKNNFVGEFAFNIFSRCADQPDFTSSFSRSLSYNPSTGILSSTFNQPNGGLNTATVYGSFSLPVWLVY